MSNEQNDLETYRKRYIGIFKKLDCATYFMMLLILAVLGVHISTFKFDLPYFIIILLNFYALHKLAEFIEFCDARIYFINLNASIADAMAKVVDKKDNKDI